MATYYKYAEREADSYIDWGTIGKNMSDMLLEQNKIREDKKAALDEASRQFGEVLANSPQGENKTAREMALEFGNNGAQYLRMLDTLLKSGQLDLKQYTINKQNLMDGTDRAFSMLTDYQKMYKEKLDRAKADENQAWELEAMTKVEEASNFSKSGLYIDPTSGKVSVSMKEKDANGVYSMSSNPANLRSVDTLNGLLLGKWDKFDSDKALNALVAANGRYINSFMAKGNNVKVEDILAQPEYELAETDAINATLTNPWNRLSVLTDDLQFDPNTNNQYRFVYSEADAQGNPDAILMKLDVASGQYVPEFSKEQMEASTEWMRGQARRRYTYEKTISQRQAQYAPSYVYERGDKRREQEDIVSQWVKIFNDPNASNKDAAAQSLLGLLQNQGSGVIAIDPQKDGVFVKWNDGRSQLIEYKVGANDVSGSQWAAAGSVVTGVNDNNIFNKHAGATFANVSDTDWENINAAYTMPQGQAATTANITPEQAKAMAKTDTASITQSIIVDDPKTTVANLEAKYGKYGFTFTPLPGAMDDEVIITPLGGGEAKTFNIDDTDDAANMAAFIVQNATSAFINAQAPGAGDGIFTPQ